MPPDVEPFPSLSQHSLQLTLNNACIVILWPDLWDPACFPRPTALGHRPHQKLITITWNIGLGLPISPSKDESGLFLLFFCIGRRSFPCFAGNKILAIYKGFYSFSAPCRPWWSHTFIAGPTPPQEVFIKVKGNTLASDQMWSENGLASWQLLCPTDSSPACRSIWYQKYLELGSWENFSVLLLCVWEKL